MIKKLVEQASSKYSNLQYSEEKLVDDGYTLVVVNGGLNGCGKWVDYMEDINDLFSYLNEHFENVYLHNVFIDNLDDVFTLEILVK